MGSHQKGFIKGKNIIQFIFLKDHSISSAENEEYSIHFYSWFQKNCKYKWTGWQGRGTLGLLWRAFWDIRASAKAAGSGSKFFFWFHISSHSSSFPWESLSLARLLAPQALGTHRYQKSELPLDLSSVKNTTKPKIRRRKTLLLLVSSKQKTGLLSQSNVSWNSTSGKF